MIRRNTLKTKILRSYALSSNSNDAVNSNNCTDTNISYSGGSAVFNGSAYIQASADIVQLHNATNFSLSLWIKPTDLSGNRSLFSKWDFPGNGTFELEAALDTLFLFICDTVADGGGNYVQTGSCLTANVWQHITILYDGSQSGTSKVKFYVNGVNKSIVTSFGTISPSLTNGTAKMVIGLFPGIGRYYSGSIKGVEVYNRTLTISEIILLYNGGNYNKFPFSSTTIVLKSNNKLLPKTQKTIIQDSSLELWLDPTNRTSYNPNFPGIWNDLSGKGQNFLAYNAPTNYPTYGGNSFNPSVASNQNKWYLTNLIFPNTDGVYTWLNDCTITMWLKSSQSATLRPFEIDGGFSQNFEFDINDGGDSGSTAMYLYYNGSGSQASAFLKSIPLVNPLLSGKWVCYTFRRDMNNAPYTHHFVNGVKVGEGLMYRVGSQLEKFFGGIGYLISGQSSLSLIGNLGSFHIYSRALTDNEILLNYQADKSKFT